MVVRKSVGRGFMKNPGKYVRTAKGRLGRTYNSERPVQGKIIVHLLGSDLSVLRDANNGSSIKILCDPATLTVKGFVD